MSKLCSSVLLRNLPSYSLGLQSVDIVLDLMYLHVYHFKNLNIELSIQAKCLQSCFCVSPRVCFSFHSSRTCRDTACVLLQHFTRFCVVPSSCEDAHTKGSPFIYKFYLFNCYICFILCSYIWLTLKRLFLEQSGMIDQTYWRYDQIYFLEI